MKEPIKYKPLWIIGSGLLYQPISNLLMNQVPTSEGTYIGHTFPEPQNSILMLATGLALGYYWVQGLEKLKPPRFQNFLRLQKIVWPSLFINRRKYPKKWLDINLELEEITYRGEFQREGLLGNYHITLGDLEQGVQHYQKLLEIDYKPKENYIWRAINEISRPVVKLRFHSNRFEDLLEIAQYELQRKNWKGMKKAWNEIKKRYPSDRTEILEGIFLTSADLPEAKDHWKGIMTKHKSELQSLGQSRNEVTEIPTDEHKSVLVIKRGHELRREFDILKKIYTQLPPEERISVVPLAVFDDEDKKCLVTLRKNSPNLDSILGITTGDETLEVSKKIIENLRRLHQLNIPGLKSYDPISELQRRLTKRFPEKDPRKLLDEYERFMQKFERRSSPVHADAYPTNVLKDGTIIDLEKASLGDPWLDLETFTTHPFLIGIQDRILANVELDPATRPLYAVHVPLCQTGSFSQQSKIKSRYFYELAKMRLRELEEKALLTATTDFLGRTIDAE